MFLFLPLVPLCDTPPGLKPCLVSIYELQAFLPRYSTDSMHFNVWNPYRSIVWRLLTQFALYWFSQFTITVIWLYVSLWIGWMLSTIIFTSLKPSIYVFIYVLYPLIWPLNWVEQIATPIVMTLPSMVVCCSCWYCRILYTVECLQTVYVGQRADYIRNLIWVALYIRRA